MIGIALLHVVLGDVSAVAVGEPEDQTDAWEAEEARDPTDPDGSSTQDNPYESGEGDPPQPTQPADKGGSPAEDAPERYNQWSLQIAPGGEFIFGGVWNALGPTFRFAAWIQAWRGSFLIGGGPAIHYTYLIDNSPAEDKLQFLTVNGDMIVGGGIPGKFAAYGHLTAGGGLIYGEDGATGTRLLLPGIRASAGFGLHGYVHRMVSLGTLVDFGYLGGLGVDAFVTLGIHFGKKPR